MAKSEVLNARVSGQLRAAVERAVAERSKPFSSGVVFQWTVSLYVEEAVRSALRKDGVRVEESGGPGEGGAGPAQEIADLFSVREDEVAKGGWG